jgi:ABC-type nitrate/sulfonate/bicarbonate transport system substrate-binding protein
MFIKDDPEIVRSFVVASLRGFLYGRAHPDELAIIVKKFSEATVPAISRREAELSFTTWVTPNTAGKPLGWMSKKDWEETVVVLKQYGGVTSPLEAEQLGEIPLVEEVYPFRVHRLNFGLLSERRRNDRRYQHHQCNAAHDSWLLS